MRGEFKNIFHALTPVLGSLLCIVQFFFELPLFLEQTFFLVGVFLVREHVAKSKVGQLVDFGLDAVVSLLQRTIGSCAVVAFVLVYVPQPFNRPIRKGTWDRHVLERFKHLSFQFFTRDKTLMAGDALIFLRAMIVGITLARRLHLFFGRNHRAALPAPNQSGERKLMLLRLWHRISKVLLHDPVFILGYHLFVHADVPSLYAVDLPLNHTVIERCAEKFVYGTFGKLRTTSSFSFAREIIPFMVRLLPNLLDGISAGQRQVPHLSDDWKAFRIWDNGMVIEFVDVAHWSRSGEPTHFQFRLDTTLDVFSKIIDVFLRHAEFHVHENRVFVLTRVRLTGSMNGKTAILNRPDDSTTVDRIASQTIELPTQNASDFAGLGHLHEFVKHWPTRSLG